MIYNYKTTLRPEWHIFLILPSVDKDDFIIAFFHGCLYKQGLKDINFISSFQKQYSKIKFISSCHYVLNYNFYAVTDLNRLHLL